ncbi:RNA-directed DNA polymerase [Halomonas qinghailakensis]|uniref:RNA-directed DNA polymerase n=1 Tax=Halomonas qinghailakensis TaxID=2937790 RepID=A0AA46YQX2_9GAMM|nr:antiviral reverse transcriptase Drt3b [Halomonas sp. ZZQ-149]UYO75023.1 RNA-directed DNA polymerase [Halomonas sp. ZZQ-149]
MKKLLRIKLKKERVILSDTLPYETPITFSNRFFYEFIIENSLSVGNGKITWNSISEANDTVISLLFGVDRNDIEKDGSHRTVQEKLGTFITVPFQYGVSHKEDSYRRLSIPHPRNQLQITNFYDKYKELILYYSQRSSFSLRYPHRIADTRFFDDERKSASVVIANQFENKSSYRDKHVKSFFGYQKIRNIHEFFESKEYHQCEKKYNTMAQLDISKCFDSIYTHSIAWAVLGKGAVKNELARNGNKTLLGCFADEFDSLMQKQNYNETNGILIGPELSRIFSELILQKVDCNLESELRKLSIYSDVHYSIFRYVDDYFVFFNDEIIYKNIVDTLLDCLSVYKLGLNTAKELIYKKPIITEITIAKRKISELLSEKIKIDIKNDEEKVSENDLPLKHGQIYIHAKTLITSFKSILSESGVEYKSVINYTLTILESKLKTIFKKYLEIQYDYKTHRDLLSSIDACIEFSFFIYNVAPRANTTIKLSRVLKDIIEFCKKKPIEIDEMHHVFKSISDNVSFVIEKYETKNYTQVETLYLLTVISELGKDYWLPESSLVKYFGGVYKSERTIMFDTTLNYFSITVILFYMKDKKRYTRAKKAVKKVIKEKLKEPDVSLKKDTELFLLLIDCTSCPFLEVNFKRELLKHFGISKKKLQDELINLRENWFTKWVDFSFSDELDSKQSDEVY